MEKTLDHFKPDFFIPGAAKSGTTSLHDLLNTHPDISMSKNKEPVYWNNKLFDQFKNFEIERYLNLFEMDKKIKGESTTSYMYYDSFIKNIKDNFQNSPKFIFILRNPIDRYISHVNWLIGLGLESKKIDEVIKYEEWAEFNEYDYYPKHYYQFGLYYKWISRFVEHFGEENIKIITFEKLINDNLDTINCCYEFLGLDKVNHVKYVRSNKSKNILFPRLYHFLRKSSIGKLKYTKIAKYLLPKIISRKIKCLMKYALQNWASIESKSRKTTIEHRKILRDVYLNDVKSLKDKFNYEFSEWTDFK